MKPMLQGLVDDGMNAAAVILDGDSSSKVVVEVNQYQDSNAKLSLKNYS